MTKNNSYIYKTIYFILAIIPQFVAFLLSFSITLNIIAFFQNSSDKNTLYWFALGIGFIWVLLIFVLNLSDTFSKLHIKFSDFIADIIHIIGYSLLGGLIAGLIIGFF